MSCMMPNVLSGAWRLNNTKTQTQTHLTLKVLVATIDALGHFETGLLQHSARGWGR